MRDEDFDALVSELEKKARQNPRRYELLVLLLALLGNAYLAFVFFAVTALFLTAVSLLFAFKLLALALLVLLGILLWTLIKALWVPMPAPVGVPVHAADAPRLFQLIEDVRLTLDGPRLHQILISEDFNAAVIQTPQLGLFGWQRNYLLIGLPLMKSLSVEQFKAVLAHEFGHLTHGHGHLCNWIYRQRLRWSQMEQVLEKENGIGSVLFKPFLSWFTAYFNVRSFPLARANEYEADAISVRLTNARVAAEALCNVNVMASYLGERYWPGIHRQADEMPHPAYAPYSTMGNRLTAELDAVSAEKWLEQSLWRTTSSGDTHPALRDRLRAIGQPPRMAPPTGGQAADQLLGSALPAIADVFDQAWRQNILPSWQLRHRAVQKGRIRLDELDRLVGAGTELSLTQAYERAHLTETVAHDENAALQQFQQLQLRAPADALINLDLGTRLLQRDVEHGHVLLELAMQLNDALTLQVCELLFDYYSRQGRTREAAHWQQRLQERRCLENESRQLQRYDRFDQHDLPQEQLQSLVRQLKSIKALRAVYLVKKHMSEQSTTSFYVLGIRMAGRVRWQGRCGVNRTLEQLRQLDIYPGETLLLALDGEYYRFENTFRSISGSRII